MPFFRLTFFIIKFTIVAIKNDKDILITIADEMEFTIKVLDPSGLYEITTTDDTLQDEWLKEVNEYCKQGKKKLRDVLIKCTAAYNNLGGGDEEVMNDDEVQEEVVVEDDDLLGGTDDPFAIQDPKKAAKKQDESDPYKYDPELEKLKEKFKNNPKTQGAINRLMKDYLQLCKAKEETKKFGFSAEPVNDDLFHWHIKLFGFDKKGDGQIAADLEQYGKKFSQNYVLMDMRFPEEYPFKPPFIRVLAPRFQYLTGHVTIGGSICMELLTMSGWVPSNSIEAIIVQIRTEMIAGNARLDFSNTSQYSEQEAKEAFNRMASKYGWKIN